MFCHRHAREEEEGRARGTGGIDVGWRFEAIFINFSMKRQKYEKTPLIIPIPVFRTVELVAGTQRHASLGGNSNNSNPIEITPPPNGIPALREEGEAETKPLAVKPINLRLSPPTSLLAGGAGAGGSSLDAQSRSLSGGDFDGLGNPGDWMRFQQKAWADSGVQDQGGKSSTSSANTAGKAAVKALSMLPDLPAAKSNLPSDDMLNFELPNFPDIDSNASLRAYKMQANDNNGGDKMSASVTPLHKMANETKNSQVESLAASAAVAATIKTAAKQDKYRSEEEKKNGTPVMPPRFQSRGRSEQVSSISSSGHTGTSKEAAGMDGIYRDDASANALRATSPSLEKGPPPLPSSSPRFSTLTGSSTSSSDDKKEEKKATATASSKQQAVRSALDMIDGLKSKFQSMGRESIAVAEQNRKEALSRMDHRKAEMQKLKEALVAITRFGRQNNNSSNNNNDTLISIHAIARKTPEGASINVQSIHKRVKEFIERLHQKETARVHGIEGQIDKMQSVLGQMEGRQKTDASLVSDAAEKIHKIRQARKLQQDEERMHAMQQQEEGLRAKKRKEQLEKEIMQTATTLINTSDGSDTTPRSTELHEAPVSPPAEQEIIPNSPKEAEVVFQQILDSSPKVAAQGASSVVGEGPVEAEVVQHEDDDEQDYVVA
eukprot:jgi/Bigna1/133359/aug1.21_g8067